jgi:hypothetical protein
MKIWLATVLLVGLPCFSQDKSTDAIWANMPSEQEISELLSKAEANISGFEQAMKIVKPTLEGIDSSLMSQALDAASKAHSIISALQKNGPSGYGLVLLVTTLDDLNSTASRSALVLASTDRNRVVTGGRPDANLPGQVVSLTSAGSASNDISELIMHATLRYLSIEEAVLGQLLDGKK